MPIFATALDNTLIFSRGFVKDEDVIAVEYKDNKELSYMTKQSLDYLKSLNEVITIIPITSRSLEEFKRITFYSMFEHAILSNGLAILHKGLVEDGNWQALNKISFTNSELWNSLEEAEKYKYSVFLLGLSDSERMLKMIKGN